MDLIDREALLKQLGISDRFNATVPPYIIGVIKGMPSKNWDMRTADSCQLPKLIPDICKKCRDYDYCHRQKTIADFMKEEKE